MLQILILTLITNPAITRDTRLLPSTDTTTTAARHSYQLLLPLSPQPTLLNTIFGLPSKPRQAAFYRESQGLILG